MKIRKYNPGKKGMAIYKMCNSSSRNVFKQRCERIKDNYFLKKWRVEIYSADYAVLHFLYEFIFKEVCMVCITCDAAFFWCIWKNYWLSCEWIDPHKNWRSHLIWPFLLPLVSLECQWITINVNRMTAVVLWNVDSYKCASNL